MAIKITRGLDIPLRGTAEQKIYSGPQITSVALFGTDYVGLKPAMLITEGDRVKLGQPIFTDRKNPGFNYTSPGCGVIRSINRGAKRVLQSIVIDLEGDDEITYDVNSRDQLTQLSRQDVIQRMAESGLWAAFRTRPYSRQPAIDATPNSIFVTAMDSRPLAAKADVVIAQYQDDFIDGLRLLSKLTEGKVHVCKYTDAQLPDASINGGPANITVNEFEGKHPCGLPGTHIHFLDPVSANKQVWHVGYQDVIAIGKLFTTGKIWTDRIISLSGPFIKKPRLIKTRLGASTEDLVRNELNDERIDARIISGSVLSGRAAHDWAAYLGRYYLQVTCLEEGREREFFGWIRQAGDRFSAINVFISAFNRARTFAFNTSTNGSARAIVPIGNYEMVMPLDILPTQLLRAIVVRDTDLAQQLGCLELDEEDLALCTYVSVSKYDYGPALRTNLLQIELEG